MNLQPQNTPQEDFRTERPTIASTKLTAPVPQVPVTLGIRIFNADDRSFPAPIGARFNDKPAAQEEIARKARQLERIFKAGGPIDVYSTIGQPSRAYVYCIHCKELVADCTCPKPAGDNGVANVEPEKPYDRARRLQREFRAARRRIKGQVP